VKGFNTLSKKVRNTAVGHAKRTEKRSNKLLYDVRNDRELAELLIDAWDKGLRVKLPVGAYLYELCEPVDNCYVGGCTYFIVNAKGQIINAEDDWLHEHPIREWRDEIQVWLGLKETKPVKKPTKKTKTR
jgi:hypothetical protein